MQMRKRYKEILSQIGEHASKGSNKNDHVLIVDGLNNFIRTWATSPATNADGQHIGGIVGFLQTIGLAIRTINPTRCIIAFDGRGGSKKRRKIFSSYKSQRKPIKRPNRLIDMSQETEQENMKRQMSRLVEYLGNLPVTVMAIQDIEADDTIGYITSQILRDSKITIMSTDKDFYQLIDDRVDVWSPTKKVLGTKERIFEDFEILSKNFIYYRIIDGDASDNINGIKGYAIKTIRKKFPFLQDTEISSLDEFLNVASDLQEHKDLLKRNYQLMQLSNVDIHGSAKLSIIDSVRDGSNRLVKYRLHKMFLEDGVDHAIKNPDVWLQTSFNKLELILQNDTTNK